MRARHLWAVAVIALAVLTGSADTPGSAQGPGPVQNGTVQRGTATTQYTYDANSNRLTRDDGVTVETGTYDDQDRATTYGGATFTYRQSGELLTKIDGAGTTTYDYDELGNLLSVTRPDGVVVSYALDGGDRRVQKRINGVAALGLLYKDDLFPIAELDGAGSLVSRFVYATRGNVPDYLKRGGVTYRIISDQIGSVRLVVDTATGTIAQRLDYDEFGRVLIDTNPGFQPFGFAGGIYDPDTGLVRFGARDYDPMTGRWTAKDPILFGGGPANLYSYVDASPLDQVDPTGLNPSALPSEEDVADALRPAPSDPWDTDAHIRYIQRPRSRNAATIGTMISVMNGGRDGGGGTGNAAAATAILSAVMADAQNATTTSANTRRDSSSLSSPPVPTP